MDFIKKSLKALSYLRISDYNEGNNYNEWLGIAAALKNIGVPYAEFDAWSSGGSNYEPEANQKTWDALNPSETTDQSIGWLIKLAQREGMPLAEVRETETAYLHQIDDTEKIISDAAIVIRLLFHENEFINLIPSIDNEEGKAEYQWTYEGKPFFTTSEKVIEWIGKNPSRHFPNGVLWRVNPLDGNDMNDKNVVVYRHALIEADGIGIQKQIEFIKKLKLPYTALVHSGNKSVHCYVKIEADNAEEFKSRVTFLYDFCLKNGFEIDKANRNPSRACRTPGVRRGDHWQYVIAHGDAEFTSWGEWYKWAAEYKVSETKIDKRSITSTENGKKGGRPPIIYQLAEQFSERYLDTDGKFTLGFHRGWFYEYKDGVYRKCEDIRIESNIMGFLQDRAKENATPNMVNSIKANLLSPNFAYLDDSIPSPFHKVKGKITDNIINMKNGLLNIDLYLKLKAQGNPT